MNSTLPTDAQMRARALSRWEGEGGTLGVAAAADDALDETELRILARIGAATLAEWSSLPSALREALLGDVCRPLIPGDRARTRARIATFLRDHAAR